jgi:hypothetical protein
MSHRTPDDALRDAIKVLGQDYGAAFHHSRQELWRISSDWDRYQALFGSQERVDLLNKSSGNFWHTVQAMIHEHVLLGLCRLTDPASTRKDRNLSVFQLADLEPCFHKKRLLQRAETARKCAEFARSWRHKRIAHNDFEQTVGAADKLKSSTGNKIKKAILAVHDVLRWIEARHFDGDMKLIEIADGDATTVMMLIDDGLKYRSLKKADYDDWQNIATPCRLYEWSQTGIPARLRYESRRNLKRPRYKKR